MMNISITNGTLWLRVLPINKMKSNNLISSVGYLMKDMIFQPSNIFNKIKQGYMLEETLTIFCLGALITFLKSFNFKSQVINFYASAWKNKFFSFLSNPQLSWLLFYVIYFIFLLSLFIVCRYFNRRTNLKTLVIALMSISSIGILGQALFFVSKSIFSTSFLLWGSYVIYFWVLYLSLQAIKITQDVSYFKALISFSLPAIVLGAFIGFSTMSPYLIWLSK